MIIIILKVILSLSIIGFISILIMSSLGKNRLVDLNKELMKQDFINKKTPTEVGIKEIYRIIGNMYDIIRLYSLEDYGFNGVYSKRDEFDVYNEYMREIKRMGKYLKDTIPKIYGTTIDVPRRLSIDCYRDLELDIFINKDINKEVIIRRRKAIVENLKRHLGTKKFDKVLAQIYISDNITTIRRTYYSSYVKYNLGDYNWKKKKTRKEWKKVL